jgi:hypothetical protein
MKIFLTKLATLSVLLSLAGCQKPNVLLDKEGVDLVRRIAFNVSYGYDFENQCRSYLLSGLKAKTKLQKQCDATLAEFYPVIKVPDAYRKATLMQLHDVRVWQQVYRVDD